MKDDFYPHIVRTDPPRVVTREEIETYFKLRQTVIKVLHMPATNPQPEDGK